jgi:uncharacterized hydrophobic protein (TIGR00271 family)
MSDVGRPGASAHPEVDLTALGRITDALRRSATKEPDADAVAAVDELFPPAEARLEYTLRFSALIVLSAAIAAFGLLSDSAGVVIGAMLVAPLMTPILAAAAATVQADNRALVRMLLTIALGTALAIAVGYVVSVVAGDGILSGASLPGELQSRTYPGLLDLGVAVSAGAAAGYIVPRRSALSALPGVGIAVALVPPLATVGITWQLGRTDEAGNALLLFVTNLAAIVFSASIMLILAGFRPRVRVSRRALTRRVLITLIAVTAVAIPLALHTRDSLRESRLVHTVSEAVTDWDESARVVAVSAEIHGGVADVEMTVSGPNAPNDVWKVAEAIRDRSGLPVELDLRYQRDGRFQVTAR